MALVKFILEGIETIGQVSRTVYGISEPMPTRTVKPGQPRLGGAVRSFDETRQTQAGVASSSAYGV